VKYLKQLLLLATIGGSVMCFCSALANECRPLMAQELTASYEASKYLVSRWTKGGRAISRLDQSTDGSTYVYAQETCVDVIGRRGAGPDGYDWRGTVSLKARDVRLYNPQTGWGNSLGPGQVETFETTHGPDGWHFVDRGAFGKHADPGGDVPELPDPASGRPLCKASEAPDPNGNCQPWRR
jgi:hypothetical protein